MALVGLLFAHHGAVGSSEPMAALEVAGLALITRQIHLLRSLGVERIYVFAERMPPGLAAALSGPDADVRIVREPRSIAEGLTDDDRVFVIEEGLLVDGSIARVLLDSTTSSLLAVWRQEAIFGHAERLDSGSFWAGLSIYDGRLVRTVAANLGEWDLQSTLLRTAVGEGAARIDVARDPELFFLVRNSNDAQRTTEALIEAAGRHADDWPSRLLHSRIEAASLPLLLQTRATASLLLALSGGLALLAAAAFAGGWLWAGLVLALLSLPMTGIAERRARIKLERLPAPHVRHRVELAIRYSWYPAIAFHLARSTADFGPWLAAAMIVLFMFAADRQRELYRCFPGSRFDEAGDPERRLQLLGAGPATLPWALLPFALLGAWYAGLVALASYSCMTFFLVQQRTFVRLAS